MKKIVTKQVVQKVKQYLLTDYEFLQDYLILSHEQSSMYLIEDKDHSTKTTSVQYFYAKIINTKQIVKFTKISFDEEVFNRFVSLYQLYEKGVILADNIFILDEADTLYFYIIEAQVDHYSPNSSKTPTEADLTQSQYDWDQGKQASKNFMNLQSWMLQKQPDQAEKRKAYQRLKILLSQIHTTGQTYNCLTSRRVIFDDEGNVYLAPFPLKQELSTDPIQCAYYSPQILQKLKNGESSLNSQELIKNDIWAFGCIMAQLFIYAMPVFLKPDIPSQLKFIRLYVDSLEPQNQSNEIWDDKDIGNIIFNCMSIDPIKRKLSTETPVHHKLKDIRNKKTKQKMYIDDCGKKGMKTRTSDCYELNVKILCVFVPIEQPLGGNEIRIDIYLDRQYSMFVQPNQLRFKKKIRGQKYQVFQINKQIGISLFSQKFEEFLKNPILIEIEEIGCQTHKIRANLYSLILLLENNQNWDKPLIGTYPSQTRNHEQTIKIKLSCHLKHQNNLSSWKQNHRSVDKQEGKTQRYREQIAKGVQNMDKKKEKSQVQKGRTCERGRFKDLNKKLDLIKNKWKQNHGQGAKQGTSYEGKQLQQNTKQIGEKIRQILAKRSIQL